MRTPAIAALLLAAGCGSTTVTPPAPADARDEASVTDAPLVDAIAPDATAPDVPAVDAPPPPPPPPPVGTLPLGSACERDEQCTSGVCVDSPGLSHECGQRCRRNADCVPLGATFNCALDRAGGGRWVCGEVQNAGEDPGGECSVDADCFSNVCYDGRCHGACAADADCNPGWRCTPFSLTGGRATYCGHAPITGVTVEPYTLYEGASTVDRGTAEARLFVPPDAVSITWTTQDLDGSDVFAAVSHVAAPDASSLVDLRTWTMLRDQPIRTVPARYQFNSATLPARDGQRVLPGAYASSHLLFNPMGVDVTSRRVRTTALVKRAPGGRLDAGAVLLRLWFVGTRTVNAASAPTNTRLTAAVDEMRRIYAAAGVGVTVLGYVDATAADAARYGVIDSPQELRELFTRTGGNPDPVLNLMFVRGISSTAGLENAVGVAGAIDGPAGANGTVASGVVVGWETTQGRTDILGQVMAHECGHYLGLWHPVEQLAGCTTSGQMGCSPFGGVDPIGDTPTDATASRNLMFWQAQGGTALSAGQGYVMRAHALVR